MPDQRFTSRYRIRRQADFDRAYQQRAYAADDVLVIHGCRTDLLHPRLGLSVSRAVGNAVVRNRWKRRIREAFRHSLAELPLSVDLVVRPKRGAQPDYLAILGSLPKLARKLAGRLSAEPPSSVPNTPRKKRPRP